MRYLKLMLLLITISCASKNDKYIVVSNENIDQEKLAFAKLISHKLLGEQSKGSYYQLTKEEATSRMVAGLNEEKQLSSYEEISGRYGHYQDLEFYQLLMPKDGTLYETYRFKGKFTSEAAVEIRTILDGNGKLTGFFITKWRDNI